MWAQAVFRGFVAFHLPNTCEVVLSGYILYMMKPRPMM